MSKAFDPEKDLPQEFWTFIRENPSDEQMRRSLDSLPKEQLISLFKALIEARTELAFQLAESGRSKEASEDALDDVSEGIIGEGRRAYVSSYRNRLPLPPRDEWEGLRGLSHLFAQAYHQRFGGNVFDELE